MDHPQRDEAELVRSARSGDETAFARLVERHGAMVMSLAYASTLSRPDAEDVVQETFLAAWRGLGAFRGDSSFATWLYELARNRCADRARRAAVRPALARHGDDHPDAATSVRGSEVRKVALSVLDAAAELPLAQQQAVLMRDIQGLSYEEIAAIQDVPVGTVRSRIASGRSRIADAVGES
jgi:RNA polymerase sigma-70 factor (ECF subfamily)